jgi:ribonuclease HI
MLLTNGRALLRRAPVHRVFTDASIRARATKGREHGEGPTLARVGLGVHRPTAALDMAVRLLPAMDCLPCSDVNYAELYAIMLGIRSFSAPMYEGSTLVLATDSLVSLQQLSQSTPHRKYIRLVDAIRCCLADHAGHALIYKVRAHAGVAGNEAAHRLARAATELSVDAREEAKRVMERLVYTAAVTDGAGV